MYQIFPLRVYVDAHLKPRFEGAPSMLRSHRSMGGNASPFTQREKLIAKAIGDELSQTQQGPVPVHRALATKNDSRLRQKALNLLFNHRLRNVTHNLVGDLAALEEQ